MDRLHDGEAVLRYRCAAIERSFVAVRIAPKEIDASINRESAGQTTYTNFEQGNPKSASRMVKTAAFAEEFCYA